MKLVAVYGSLKKGFYNHHGLGEDKKHLGNITVRGVMYSNGAYPKLYHPINELVGALEGGLVARFVVELARDHVVEVYEISDKDYNSITQMEVGAGYTPEDIETPWGVATIYYMPHSNFHESDYWVESY
jgi:gamma-glutamylcyclotransferase (GGCT)/AIG2-like uncharacterized protein YtfP